jgi:hypothetical protein
MGSARFLSPEVRIAVSLLEPLARLEGGYLAQVLILGVLLCVNKVSMIPPASAALVPSKGAGISQP